MMAHFSRNSTDSSARWASRFDQRSAASHILTKLLSFQLRPSALCDVVPLARVREWLLVGARGTINRLCHARKTAPAPDRIQRLTGVSRIGVFVLSCTSGRITAGCHLIVSCRLLGARRVLRPSCQRIVLGWPRRDAETTGPTSGDKLPPIELPKPLPSVSSHGPGEDPSHRPYFDLVTPAIWLITRGTNEIKNHQLEVAAAATGGVHYRAIRDRTIRSALDRIGSELHAQYIIG